MGSRMGWEVMFQNDGNVLELHKVDAIDLFILKFTLKTLKLTLIKKLKNNFNSFKLTL